jgi:hypothetical protein
VDEPQPIPEFEGRAPLKLWRHGGIDCAIYMGHFSPCGYVRLPDDSPLRPIAAAADVVLRAEQGDGPFGNFIDRMPEGHLGYEGLDDLLTAHGGLNWGPVASGWVGFDTGHVFDIWDLDEIRSFMDREDEVFRQAFELLVSRGVHPSQVIAGHLLGYEIHWTLEKLVRVVEDLAEQVAKVQVQR